MFASYAAIAEGEFESAFRISRAVHLLLLRGLLLRLLTAAGSRNRMAWGLLAAAMNIGNTHELSLAAIPGSFRSRGHVSPCQTSRPSNT